MNQRRIVLTRSQTMKMRKSLVIGYTADNSVISHFGLK